MRHTRQRAARGRGNQGDWTAPEYVPPKIDPDVAKHNAEVEAKKAAKKARKRGTEGQV